MNNNQKTFIAMGLMVALAFVVVGASSFATPVSAAPPSPPAGKGQGDCASSEFTGRGPQSADCPRPVPPTVP